VAILRLVGREIACRTGGVGISATATLYVLAAGAPLPVAEVASEGQIHLSVVFSKWNERVSVTAPAGAVPLR
jgi:hypothetical protein